MYETFYQLSDKPFRLTPDTTMLFPSNAHQRAMSYLVYGLDQGEGFVMITGAVGTGKTLLIQKLLKDCAQRNIAIASVASANLDSEDILPAVASAFDLPYTARPKETLLRDLRWHLSTLNSRHTHALLVVDEAQTLTPAALEMLRILSNMENGGHALLQVFLVGQTELRQIIVANRLEQLRQRIVASYRLEPLEEDEARDYIVYRLKAVGWVGDPQLDPVIFRIVHKESGGIPRKINLIMDRLLLYGYLEDQHSLGTVALRIVLEEMRDEMPEAPGSLEVSDVHPTTEAPEPPTKDDPREVEIEHQRMLVELMREEVRLRAMLRREDAEETDAALRHRELPAG